MDYLRWYRQVLALPIENGIDVLRIRPMDGLLALELADGRRITPQGGDGDRTRGSWPTAIPDFMREVPAPLLGAHLGRHRLRRAARQARRRDRRRRLGDGQRRRGAGGGLRRVAACWSAAPTLPRINKLTGIGSSGFTNGYRAMSEAWRWRTMHYADETGRRRHAIQRCGSAVTPMPNFHFNASVVAIRVCDDTSLCTPAAARTFAADFIILATGFTVETAARPEIAAYADAIATWADRYTPPPELANAELGGFPYLGPHFQFTEKRPRQAPFLADIHCFNHAASLSIGKVAGDIPGISTGAEWLAAGIAAEFYNRDIEAHWQILLDFDQARAVRRRME